MLAGTLDPAVMAHPHEARGQAMGEPALEEGIHRQRDDVRAVRATLETLQQDVAGLVIPEQTLRPERGAEDIFRQIAQGGLAATGVADVGNPLAAEDLRVLLHQTVMEVRVIGFECEFESVAEAGGQWRAVDQELRLGWQSHQFVAPIMTKGQSYYSDDLRTP